MTKKILVAVLNWGLGHATRCIPIIKGLQEQGFEPVIASNGEALQLLQKEFPALRTYSLPGYNIRYAEKGSLLKWKLLWQVPHILRTITSENKGVNFIIKAEGIAGIISDNRWGARSSEIPSVFITHQVKVLSGATTFFSSKIQQYYIQKFTECWVPDIPEEPGLSGEMGHPSAVKFPIKYLGILSRLEKEEIEIQYDIAVVLSGPEPQRELLEKALMELLLRINKTVIFIKGIVENEQKIEKAGNITIYNYVTSPQLQFFLNSSDLVICRPGYTSLMDLAKLEKKVFLIPTPGQPEQEYLAQRLWKSKQAAGCHQQQLSMQKLEGANDFPLLRSIGAGFSAGSAFALFKGE